MMDGRCATCKYWELDQEEQVREGLEPMGECAQTRWTGMTYSFVDSKAHAFADDPVYAVLLTAPDFGCVQWEPKDTDALSD